MKTKISSFVIFLSVFFPLSIFAQYLQMDFPLQVGNLWQYSEVPGHYSESNAIKDTLMPNNRTYTVVKGELFSGVFRKDSSKIFIYNSSTNNESVYFDFSKKTGDTLSLYVNSTDTIVTIIYEEGISSIFGLQKHYISFLTKSSSSTGYSIKTVTDGFGFTTYNGEVLAYGLSGAIINGNQYGIILNVEDGEINRPSKYQLLQNYPNPFNPNTIIEYHLNSSANVRINVYNVLGKHMTMLLDEYKNAGKYKVIFHGNNLSSGIYYYTINVNGISETKCMVLQK